jgi:UDP-GlcNAc:undecaprenyl-phosphate GlcNAc-1-phosphate transferase
MKNLVIFFFAHMALNLIIYFFLDYLKKKINIYDHPDQKKKLHSKPIPLIGGWIFLFNLILFLVLKQWVLSSLEKNIILCSSFFLLIGIIDDKYNLSAYSKFISLAIGLFFFFSYNENLIIRDLKIYDYNIYLNSYTRIFLSVFCVLLFVNAFNLFDGINLQSSLYGIYFLIFLFYKGLFLEIILIIIISLILIIYLNSKNKIFMGDSGTLFLGSFISLLVIANYNIENSLTVDQIFLLMFLPGVDMFRLFIQRILCNQSPFAGDREHLHHYLLKIYGFKFTILFILTISILPSILSFFIDSKFVIIFFIIFYLSLFIFLKKKITK